ncbi:MAG: Hsp20/alpha crystallin, variant 2 [Marteilia pararefringens]
MFLKLRTMSVTAKREEKRGSSTISREFKRQLEIPSSVDSQKFQCFWGSNNKLKVSAPLKLSDDNAEKGIIENSRKSRHKESSGFINKKSSNISNLPLMNGHRTPLNNLHRHSSKHERSSENYQQIKDIERRESHNKYLSTSTSACAPLSGNVRKSISGSYYETIMDLNDDSLLNCRDIRVEFDHKSLTIRVIFHVESAKNCWNEEKEVIRSMKLPKSLQYGEISKTKVYLNKLSRHIVINVPLNEVRTNNMKELRVDFRRK